ncbi:MAG: 3'-5' exonuclease [Armatimonadota bacterium]|nr:3'-5' exonuclease [Armatimonadota bacterium]MDR7559937.1 3'-5' exonuclease [Armatimonadota bacterium]MDR7587506.1 3'-5' exonuclease [Armatimonadota bacterium]MDR7610911.1 3'-5' exonuclease [Armatimonadota bacterium]
MTAFLIPENIASRDDLSSTLRSVAQALRDSLPDDVTVWLEGEREGAPYLLVLDPSCGALVLDAMDERGLRAALGRWPPDRIGEVSALVGERRWAEVKALRARAAKEPLIGDGLAVGVAIAAPLLGREWLTRRYGNRAAAAVILTKEDLERENLPSAVRHAIAESAERPRVVQEAVARAVLHPEIVISRPDPEEEGQLVFRPPRTETEDVIRVLDREQERLARRLDGGYRVIRGVAGSGKTLVLMYRAKFLAESFPSWRILLTCFNICLAKALEHELKLRSVTQLPDNVEVRHIDSVAARVIQQAGRRVPTPENPDDWIKMRELAISCLRERPGLRVYDAVLVDEGQDFDGLSLDLAWSLLRDGRDHFVIALDGAQNIYRKSARWHPPGLTARGRTTILKVNYRNTKEILGFAWRFLAAGARTEELDELLDDPGMVVPPEATPRRGPEPEVVSCRDTRAEIREIVDRICRAHEQGVPWGAMAVILGNPRRQGALYYETKRRGVPYFWVAWKSYTKHQVTDHSDKVRAFTIHAAKGLEFSHVFFCGVNEIYDPGAAIDPAGRRRLAYVAMTRATEHLTVTVSGDGDVGRAILEAVR